MCLMCIEIAKGKMTISEARRALPELVSVDKNDPNHEHYLELQKADDDELLKKAQSFKKEIK